MEPGPEAPVVHEIELRRPTTVPNTKQHKGSNTGMPSFLLLTKNFFYLPNANMETLHGSLTACQHLSNSLFHSN